jgi:hypothetical protein
MFSKSSLCENILSILQNSSILIIFPYLITPRVFVEDNSSLHLGFFEKKFGKFLCYSANSNYLVKIIKKKITYNNYFLIK